MNGSINVGSDFDIEGMDWSIPLAFTITSKALAFTESLTQTAEGQDEHDGGEHQDNAATRGGSRRPQPTRLKQQPHACIGTIEIYKDM